MVCEVCGTPGIEGAPCARCAGKHAFQPGSLAGVDIEVLDERVEPDAPEAALVGHSLDARWRVDAFLARGGMGAVYRGMDLHLQRPVAIKFLDARFRSDRDVVTRFRREALAAAALDHPNLVSVYGVGEVEGLPYFVMKFVDGITVSQRMAQYGRIPLRDALTIAIQVCEGLEEIHRHHFVHRDVKPTNVMIDSRGNALVLDFGILRQAANSVTQTGFVTGTPEYMAPEQARNSRLAEPRSDLYALGVTLFEMMCGERPFRGETPVDLILAHVSEPPPLPTSVAPELPPECDALVLRAIAKEPSARYANATEMRGALLAVLERLPAEPTPTWTRAVVRSPRVTPAPTAAFAPTSASTPSAPPDLVPVPTGASALSQPSVVIAAKSRAFPMVAMRRRGWVLWLAGIGASVTVVAVLFFVLREGPPTTRPSAPRSVGEPHAPELPAPVPPVAPARAQLSAPAPPSASAPSDGGVGSTLRAPFPAPSSIETRVERAAKPAAPKGRARRTNRVTTSREAAPASVVQPAPRPVVTPVAPVEAAAPAPVAEPPAPLPAPAAALPAPVEELPPAAATPVVAPPPSAPTADEEPAAPPVAAKAPPPPAPVRAKPADDKRPPKPKPQKREAVEVPLGF